jgi:hypothetical protein
MARRTIISAIIAAAVLSVGLLAFLFVAHEQGASGDQRSGPDWGAAGTSLGGTAGFTLDVTHLERQALNGAPVTMVTVVFANTSTAQQRADPSDFTMTYRGGMTAQPTFVAGSVCALWPRTDLVPAEDSGQALRDSGAQVAGATFGPVTLCFRAESAERALTLTWDPDVSIFLLDSPTVIPLR